MQLGGHPESVCKEAGGTRGSSEPAESFGLPQCNAEPAGRLEANEEDDQEEGEGCRSGENPPDRANQSYSDAVTDALLPKQEGEVTYCSHAKHQKNHQYDV